MLHNIIVVVTLYTSNDFDTKNLFIYGYFKAIHMCGIHNRNPVYMERSNVEIRFTAG